MSDLANRRYVLDLIAEGLEPAHAARPLRMAALGAAPPDPLDDVARDLEALRARYATEPAEVARELRAFFHDGTITDAEVKAWIDTWHLATHDPDAFVGQVDAVVPAGAAAGLGSWIGELRGWLHHPAEVSDQQRAQLEKLAAKYHLATIDDLNPNIRRFETFDPAWVPLAAAKLKERRGGWPNLAAFREHSDTRPFVYDYTGLDDSKGLALALFADFGTGYAHALRIAAQIANGGYPLAFHLGDVYYAGRQAEFATNFEAPLASLVTLFCMPENHELYSGGIWYLDYLDRLRAGKRTPQEGTYFAVRLRHHQIIAIDVNWKGRQRYAYEPTRAWLTAQLEYGKQHGLTTILLTGSAPYAYDEADPRPLYADDLATLVGTSVGLWFWGDDHYCALFDRDEAKAPFIGSCIGHAGFPGKQQKPGKSSYVAPTWLETEPRFPAWTELRQDMTDNGWCEITLRPDGGADLCYVDWLGEVRCRAHTDRGADGRLILHPPDDTRGKDRGAESHVPELHRGGR